MTGDSRGDAVQQTGESEALLRDRLTRRGLVPPSVALAASLLHESRAAALPALLIESTVGAAVRVAAGSSAPGIVSARSFL